jgi:hypothetical protein
VPTRNGSPPDAPDGGHITQCGATLDAAAREPVACGAPPLAAAVDPADMPDEGEDPPLVADVDAVADVVVVDPGKASSPRSPAAPPRRMIRW